VCARKTNGKNDDEKLSFRRAEKKAKQKKLDQKIESFSFEFRRQKFEFFGIAIFIVGEE